VMPAALPTRMAGQSAAVRRIHRQPRRRGSEAGSSWILEEACVRDESGQTCLTRSQLETLLSGQSAAAGAPLLRGTVEAPTGQPSSSEDDDSSDSTQPTSASVQSATTSAPDGAKSVENLDLRKKSLPNRFPSRKTNQSWQQPTTTPLPKHSYQPAPTTNVTKTV
jgi:hypothetical protein